MKHKKKKSKLSSKTDDSSDSSNESDLGTEIDLELSNYAGDCIKLMSEVFKILGDKKLKNMTPTILKPVSINDIKATLVEESMALSKKRIISIMNGQEYTSSSESEDELPDPNNIKKEIDVISLESISDDSDIVFFDDVSSIESNSLNNSKGKKKRKDKHSHAKRKHKKKIKIEVTDTDLKKSSKKKEVPAVKNKTIENDDVVTINSTDKAMTALELLELQARARAIKSQLALETMRNESGDEVVIKKEENGMENVSEQINQVPSTSKGVSKVTVEPPKPKKVKLRRDHLLINTTKPVPEVSKEPAPVIEAEILEIHNEIEIDDEIEVKSNSSRRRGSTDSLIIESPSHPLIVLSSEEESEPKSNVKSSKDPVLKDKRVDNITIVRDAHSENRTVLKKGSTMKKSKETVLDDTEKVKKTKKDKNKNASVDKNKKNLSEKDELNQKENEISSVADSEQKKDKNKNSSADKKNSSEKDELNQTDDEITSAADSESKKDKNKNTGTDKNKKNSSGNDESNQKENETSCVQDSESKKDKNKNTGSDKNKKKVLKKIELNQKENEASCILDSESKNETEINKNDNESNVESVELDESKSNNALATNMSNDNIEEGGISDSDTQLSNKSINEDINENKKISDDSVDKLDKAMSEENNINSGDEENCQLSETNESSNDTGDKDKLEETSISIEERTDASTSKEDNLNETIDHDCIIIDSDCELDYDEPESTKEDDKNQESEVNLEEITWKSRWLESKHVKNVLQTSKLYNNVKRKLNSRKTIQQSKIVEPVTEPKEQEHINPDVDEGSVQHFELLNKNTEKS